MRKLSMSAARFLPAAAMLLRVSAAHADIDATGDWLITHEFLGSYVEHWTQTGTTLTTAGGFTGAIDPGTGSFSLEGPPFGVCPLMTLPDTLSGTVAPDGHTLAATHTIRSGSPSLCLHGLAFAVVGTRCGVGTVDPGEQCDDGNMQSGDGCDAQCQVEPCFLCSGEPSLCTNAPAGAACDDGNPCTTSACDGGGMCAASGPVDCDDGRGCTLDSCDALLGCVHLPDVRSCRSAQTTKLVVNSAAATDKLLWKWLRGESTSQSEFADPLSAAAYSFCVFAGTAAIVVEADIPPDAQRWTALGSTGFKYRDASGAADGMQKIILRGSGSDATKIAVKGSGAGLSLTEPPLVPPLTAQLTNYDTDVCWSATYEMADILRNLQGKLKAKTSSP